VMIMTCVNFASFRRETGKSLKSLKVTGSSWIEANVKYFACGMADELNWIQMRRSVLF
jgi:hypothetical protein